LQKKKKRLKPKCISVSFYAPSSFFQKDWALFLFCVVFAYIKALVLSM